jgi:hypothetical protein
MGPSHLFVLGALMTWVLSGRLSRDEDFEPLGNAV